MAARAQSEPVVTNAVQITADPTPARAHTSPQVARNPETGELVIVEADIRGSRRCVIHISVDDGRSWFQGGEPLVPPFTDCSFKADWGPYATLAFDDDGVLYMAIEASDRALFDLDRSDIPRHVFLAKSSDSGRNWTTTMVYRAPEDDPERVTNKGATVAVDRADPRYVYVGWRQGAFGEGTLKSQIAASADGGETWSPPVEVSDERGGDFPWLTVTPDGNLHAVTWTRVPPDLPEGAPDPVRELFHVSSSDRGATFSERHVIDPGNQQHEHPPVIASDPESGALYVAWSAQPDAMNGDETYEADLELYFRASTDGGITWTDKMTLNDDGPAPANQIDPGISVAPNGRIDVAWYDGRNSPAEFVPRTEEGSNDVYYTYSTDGGATWAENVRVSDRAIDRSIGVWANNIDQTLNVGIASSNDAAYVAWQDTRNGDALSQSEDVYFASVRLDGPVAAVPASSGVPTWVLVGIGVALGVALMAVVGRLLPRARAARPASA